MRLESYKEYLSEALDSRIQSGFIGDTSLGNLRPIQHALNNAETLSELLQHIYNSADLLSKEIGTDWINRLQETATEGQLHDYRMMINPTDITLSRKEPRFLALYTDPQKVVQHSGEVAYIGVSEVHLKGGQAIVTDNAKVRAEGISRVRAYHQASIIAADDAKVTLSGFCQCEAYDNADVDALLNSTVIARGSNHVRLTDGSRGIAYTGNQRWELENQSLLLIPADYNSRESLLVKMGDESHVFNCAEHIKIGINQQVGSKADIITCASQPIQEALLQIFLSPQKEDRPTRWLNLPIPLEESRHRLLPALPSNLNKEEIDRFYQAKDDRELCAAVESIMRHYPGHGISADTLASAFTNVVLQQNHIRLYGTSLVKPEPNSHYHLYGNIVFCPDYGDQSIYHINGRSVAICQSNTPVIAGENALLIQLGRGTKGELYGNAKGLLMDGGSVVAHEYSRLTAAGVATIAADGHTHVVASGKTAVQLNEHATAICKEQSKVEAYGESRVVATDEAKVDLYGKSHGAAVLDSQASVTIRSKEAVGGILEKEEFIDQFLHHETTSAESKAIIDSQEQRNGWKR